MRLSRADLLALLIALGAGITGVVVWNHGTVDLGMTLMFDGQYVRVQDVTPGGNADRSNFYPGLPVIALSRIDGQPVGLGDPMRARVAGTFDGEAAQWGYSGPYPVGMNTDGTEIRLPVEAISKDEIATVVAGDIEPDANWVYSYAAMDRGYLEYALQQSIWIAAVGLLIGLLVWRLLAHGLAGTAARGHAITVGAAVATPALIFPAVQVGTPAGIAAGYLVPIGVALVLGISLARRHPERQWVQTAIAASLVAAGLAAILVLRYLTAPSLPPSDDISVFVLAAAIGVVPALIAGAAPGTRVLQRASLASLGLMPAAALTLVIPDNVQPALPIALLAALIGWQLLPIERGAAAIGGRANAIRSGAATLTVPMSDPAETNGRDLIAYLLLGASVFLALAGPIVSPYDTLALGAWAVVLGVGLATLVGFAIRRGFLGNEWTDVAVPLAAAVGVPVILANLSDGGQNLQWTAIPTAIAALLVASTIARRHSDPLWRNRLTMWAGILFVAIVLFALARHHLAIPLIGVVPLIPAIPVAYADVPGEPRALTARLETMAVALTPGVAATMLVPSIGLLLLAVWLIAMVVWRQFTLNPLVGLANRTQLQRDLAVAAAETERARLAADLHDDALQQLSMLVRTLDEGGHKTEADEAREVATKLRAVVGDLRLPILDDLGAGAALEWLVERVEPLAGGPVKLERSDETRPPANVELAVFRVAQEALTNAIKHGKPPIAVHYDVRADGRVTLAVDDAGAGIAAEAAEEAPRQGHFGLANMQQRAEQIGALLDVRRWPAGGTRVALEWRPQ